MIITNSLGSNYSGEDIGLSLLLLFQPWKWQRGPELEILKSVIPAKAGIYTNRFRVKPGMTSDVRLFYKGRQAIGEALRILKIGPGDEVIVQAFTCVAVVRPILESGATPIYVDVAYRRLNPPLSSIKAAVSSKTKAVILQHTLGYVNPENEKIVSWCKQKGISIIQDLAHSLGAPGLEKVRPPRVGPLEVGPWEAKVLSFSQDKVVDGVSGGGLVTLNPPSNSVSRLNDSNHLTLIKNLLYPVCTWMIRSSYQYGIGGFTVGKGIHWLAKAIGLMNSPVEGNCIPVRMPNAPAVLALHQFKRLGNISNHRREIALLYNEALNSKLKVVSKDEILAGANLRYPIWVNPARGGVNNRDELEEKLKKHGFYLVDHWYDAPVSPEWVDPKEVKYLPGSCPNAEELSKHIFNLPTHINISAEKAEKLANLINIYQNTSKRPGLFRKAWPFYNSLIYIKRDWENQLDKFPEANFLQSWEWGEFHQNLGNKIYRVAIPATTATKGETFCGCFLAIVKNAKRGRYLEIPGGPLLSNYSSLSLWKQTVLLMKEVAQKENCVFIRIRPQIVDAGIATPALREGLVRNDVIRSLGFWPAPMHLHAELTRVLDLTKTDEQLLSQMRKSTRYEIRRAQKLEIKVEQSDDENLVDEFVKLQSETARREGFVPFAREYLLEQFRAFKKTGSALWFWVSNPTVISSDQRESRDLGDSSTTLGMTQKKISMAFVIFYRGEAVYHYASSSDEARKIPAAYVIQWAIIQEAKKRGCKLYNLWGDVPDDKLKSHRFAGPSLFKRGFGGKQIVYLHAHDLPLTKRYWLNYAVEIVRKSFRSL